MLSKSALKTEILKLIDPEDPLFVGFPADDAAAAANWAGVYDAYASLATDVSTDIVASKNPSGLESAINIGPGDASVGANAFGAGFTAYWTGGVFVIGIPPASGIGGTGLFLSEITSVVLAVVGSGLTSAMEAIFGTNDDAIDAIADNLADAFHNATTGDVDVRIDGLDTTPAGSSGPLPIYNEDKVY